MFNTSAGRFLHSINYIKNLSKLCKIEVEFVVSIHTFFKMLMKYGNIATLKLPRSKFGFIFPFFATWCKFLPLLLFFCGNLSVKFRCQGFYAFALGGGGQNSRTSGRSQQTQRMTEHHRILPDSAGNQTSMTRAPPAPNNWPTLPRLFPALTASLTHWSWPCMAPASPRQQPAVRHWHRTATVMQMSASWLSHSMHLLLYCLHIKDHHSHHCINRGFLFDAIMGVLD